MASRQKDTLSWTTHNFVLKLPAHKREYLSLALNTIMLINDSAVEAIDYW